MRIDAGFMDVKELFIGEKSWDIRGLIHVIPPEEDGETPYWCIEYDSGYITWTTEPVTFTFMR